MGSGADMLADTEPEEPAYYMAFQSGIALEYARH